MNWRGKFLFTGRVYGVFCFLRLLFVEKGSGLGACGC